MSIPHDALRSMQFGTPPQPARRIRTLVVDDDPAMLEATCCMLEFQGMVEVVGQARDGLQAIEAASELNPELVIMDVHMPVMDGLQAARLLARHFPEITIVLMSGDQSQEVREQCDASGADAFLFKVDFPRELDSLMRRLFPDPCFGSVA